MAIYTYSLLFADAKEILDEYEFHANYMFRMLIKETEVRGLV